MRWEQFVVQSAASACTGNEAPVAPDTGTRFFRRGNRISAVD